MTTEPDRTEIIERINGHLNNLTSNELLNIWGELMHDANPEREEELCGIQYTCLGDRGDGDVGERFSGGGDVHDPEDTANFICGEHGLRSVLLDAINDPPKCIMLHIQTSPPAKRRDKLHGLQEVIE